MNEPRTLTAIEPQMCEGYMVIPKGMTPVYLHHELQGGRPIAYVENWTPDREYDGTQYDLYLLSNARQFIVPLTDKIAGTTCNQRWYDQFGEPTKEALKASDKLMIRERARTAV